MFHVKKEGSKQNVLVSDFGKMFAKQISRLQSKVCKNLKVGAQR